MDKTSTRTLVSKLNAVKDRKPVYKSESLPIGEWYMVNYIKHENWYDSAKKSQVHAVKLDTPEFVYFLPPRQCALILKEVFGLGPDGKSIQSSEDDSTNQNLLVNDGNFAVFPGMEFCVSEKKEGTVGVFYTIDFRTNGGDSQSLE